MPHFRFNMPSHPLLSLPDPMFVWNSRTQAPRRPTDSHRSVPQLAFCCRSTSKVDTLAVSLDYNGPRNIHPSIPELGRSPSYNYHLSPLPTRNLATFVTPACHPEHGGYDADQFAEGHLSCPTNTPSSRGSTLADLFHVLTPIRRPSPGGPLVAIPFLRKTLTNLLVRRLSSPPLRLLTHS